MTYTEPWVTELADHLSDLMWRMAEEQAGETQRKVLHANITNFIDEQGFSKLRKSTTSNGDPAPPLLIEALMTEVQLLRKVRDAAVEVSNEGLYDGSMAMVRSKHLAALHDSLRAVESWTNPLTYNPWRFSLSDQPSKEELEFVITETMTLNSLLHNTKEAVDKADLNALKQRGYEYKQICERIEKTDMYFDAHRFSERLGNYVRESSSYLNSEAVAELFRP